MNQTASNNTTSHAVYWQLILVFIIALLLFSALRWQPENWIQAKIEQQSQQHGIQIRYKELNIKGLTLELADVSIQQIKPATFDLTSLDTITLSPAWSSLLQATIAVHVQVSWHQQHADAIINQADDTIIIQSLHGQINAATLQPLFNDKLPIPLHIKGIIQVEANADIDSNNGRPLRGDIHLSWHDATLTMPSLQLPPLGHYQLDLHNNDANTPWQWNLTGGKALALNGKGSLNTSSPSMQTWQLNGNIHVQADQQIPLFVSLLGKADKQFQISGNILQPRLQPL